MSIRITFIALVLATACCSAWAKLPAAPADPAKAAADKQKADDAAKKDADLLAKYQDKAVANYKKNKGIATSKKK